MSQARVAVLKVVSKQATVGEAAASVGLSRRQLHRLLKRYREGGLEALEPRSRRPKTNSGQTPEPVRKGWSSCGESSSPMASTLAR